MKSLITYFTQLYIEDLWKHGISEMESLLETRADWHRPYFTIMNSDPGVPSTGDAALWAHGVATGVYDNTGEGTTSLIIETRGSLLPPRVSIERQLPSEGLAWRLLMEVFLQCAAVERVMLLLLDGQLAPQVSVRVFQAGRSSCSSGSNRSIGTGGGRNSSWGSGSTRLEDHVVGQAVATTNAFYWWQCATNTIQTRDSWLFETR